jgi:hypothetical protein
LGVNLNAKCQKASAETASSMDGILVIVFSNRCPSLKYFLFFVGCVCCCCVYGV